jgi:acetoin:2,6-dichlorophenolindophenol oxidoreductase subunit alpha
VDGNNILAVYEAAKKAVERARAGDGPTLLECKTWRKHQHALRDVVNPDRRPPELIEYWTARDPIEGFERYLVDRGIMTADQLADVGQTVDQDLVDAVAFAEASPYPQPEEALEDVFAR